MIYVRRIVGHSMLPCLKPDRVVIFARFKRLRVGDVVLACCEGKEYVKRIVHLTSDMADLAGDNVADSRDLPGIPPQSIKATLLWPRYANMKS